MKTIKDLNSKWWYRLLKVVYICAAVVAIFMVGMLVVGETAPYIVLDLDGSKLVCLNKDKTTNFSISFSEVNRIKDSRYAYKILEEDGAKDELVGELCVIKKPEYQSAYIPISNNSQGLDIQKWSEARQSRADYEKQHRGEVLVSAFLVLTT